MLSGIAFFLGGGSIKSISVPIDHNIFFKLIRDWKKNPEFPCLLFYQISCAYYASIYDDCYCTSSSQNYYC
jgi:hypothetical protein